MAESRYEFKYLIPDGVTPFLREYIRPHVRPDEFTAGNAAGYTINSLYLDSPRLRLFHMTLEGIKNRYKLRIRSYSPHPEAPVFLEVKRRENKAMKKIRAGLNRETATELLRGQTRRLVELPLRDRQPAEQFLVLARHIQARPVVYIQYKREAYESIHPEPLRITFDTELGYALFTSSVAPFWPDRVQATRMPSTILEIKYTDRFPAWVQRMVHTFGLIQQSVPKYVLSMQQALGGTSGGRISGTLARSG